MKHPAGYAKPRRLAAPRKKRVRLDLKRRPQPEPEDDVGLEQKSNFWKWLLFVALLHLLVLGIAYFIYESAPAPKPPEQFISLLPQGDVVKGTAGTQQAHKLGHTTPAPAHHASTPPPVAAAPLKPITPPPAVVPPPQPSLLSQDKPIIKPTPKPKPSKPTPPKVKVDLTLADGPTPTVTKAKPKPHHKKPVVKPSEDTDDQDDTAKADSSGLSKEQIAEKLGEKLDAAGVKNATKSGTSGSANSHANSYADFYAAIRDQVMSQWQSPNLTDETAVNPIVEIHVEKDGQVPPDSVHLIQSSGNPTYDDSAIAAAKGLGYLHEPLPDGCPPDIPITFKLTR